MTENSVGSYNIDFDINEPSNCTEMVLMIVWNVPQMQYIP